MELTDRWGAGWAERPLADQVVLVAAAGALGGPSPSRGATGVGIVLGGGTYYAYNCEAGLAQVALNLGERYIG